jgi:roadblock/LC7 domain-containing protein
MNTSGPAIHYVAGGTVQAGEGVYVERPADAILPRLCREGAFAYVFTPRQMGKSSLMIRTAETLLNEGIKPVIVDLTELGANATADQWYRGVLEKIAEQLELRTSVADWWDSHQQISVAQRFNGFLTDIVLREIPERIVIFVDEIDTTLRLNFTDDFFASIRYLYNARATTKALARLSFVLLGVASPGDLMKDPERTPFNIGQRVDLDDFTEDEAVRDLRAERELVRAVFRYTSGHPYLTLRVFQSLAEHPLAIESLFFGDQANKDSNLQFVRDMLTIRAPDREAVLLRYRDVWRGKQVPDKEADPVCAWLRLSGIVRRTDGLLQVRNEIYRRVFDDAWISKNRKVNWARATAIAAGAALGLLILVAAALAPFAYVQRNDAVAAQKQEKLAGLNERAQRQKAEWAAVQERASRTEALEQSERATQAEAEAKRYSQLATARGLSAQSLLLRTQSPTGIATYSLLGVESFRHTPTLDALQALPDDLALLRHLKSRLAHQGAVSSVAFSPDGRLVVTRSNDKTARVFEAATGKEVACVAHRGEVLSVAFSPDGRLVATGSSDGTARVFESATGREVSRLVHQNRVNAVAFSPDGRLVATGSDLNTARLFESATGREATPLDYLLIKANSSAQLFQPPLILGSGDIPKELLEQLNRPRPFPGHVYSVAFSPDGRLVATGSLDHTARVFESSTGKEVARLATDAPVNFVVFSPDGRLVATDGGIAVVVFDSGTGKTVARLPTGLL